MRSRFFVASAVLGLFLVGCSGEQKAQQGQQQQAPQAVPVPALTVKSTPINLSYEYPARLKSVEQAQVVAKVNGTLLKKSYTEGAFVKEGALLFKIDPKKYQATYDKAKANLGVAEAALKNAERSKNRVESLYKDKAVSEQERDSVISNYEIALAQVEASRAVLNDAQIDLDYTSVTAPIGGMAGQKLIDAGNYIGAQTILTTITKLDPIYAEFSIPDSDLAKAKSVEGGVAKIILENGKEFTGKVNFFDSVIDDKSGTIALRAEFKNSNNELIPGQFGRIRLENSSSEPLILVPQKAVMQSPQGSSVYIVENGIAEIRLVVLGETIAKGWVIKSGLKDGDIVIVDNITKVRPKSPVKPMEGKQ